MVVTQFSFSTERLVSSKKAENSVLANSKIDVSAQCPICVTVHKIRKLKASQSSSDLKNNHSVQWKLTGLNQWRNHQKRNLSPKYQQHRNHRYFTIIKTRILFSQLIQTTAKPTTKPPKNPNKPNKPNRPSKPINNHDNDHNPNDHDHHDNDPDNHEHDHKDDGGHKPQNLVSGSHEVKGWKNHFDLLMII